MMNVTSFINNLAFILVFVGAFNWGLVGGFDYNIITTLFGTGTLTTVFYVATGVAAIYSSYVYCAHCKACMTGKK